MAEPAIVLLYAAVAFCAIAVYGVTVDNFCTTVFFTIIKNLMKVLVVHNRYKDRTGEDSVFDREVSLLRSHSNQVDIWTVDNRAVKAGTALEKISLAKSTIWSRKANKELSEKLLEAKPDIVHVHNTLPLLSPSIFHACHRANIPVVHTLHNYRLICPSNTLFRDGQICEKCVSGTLLNSVRYGCYRSSRTQTAAVAAMLQYHRWINTWSHRIDGYIALSEFQKAKIVASGIAEDKIYIKPNFIESIPQETTKVEFGSYYLFVGRLIDEKGVQLLIEGYKKANSKYPLIIMGPGYLQEMVTQAALEDERIKYVGIQSKEDVLSWMKGAITLLFPSIWHECSPMTILEAFSCSLPVISVRLWCSSGYRQTSEKQDTSFLQPVLRNSQRQSGGSRRITNLGFFLNNILFTYTQCIF